ncbi:MAG: glycerate kinase, partial [Microcella sp.]|nr:glycerate kinase [Microcella sp.]
AVVELAECCGITLLPLDADGRSALAPLTASSRGVGDAIAAALDSGARRVTLALGGSASTDAGFGALSALGLRALDDTGDELEPGGAALEHLATIDTTTVRSPPPDSMMLLTDTTAVLCGPNGAAVVFGPQKGAGPELVSQLNQALAQAAAVSSTLLPSPDRPWLAAIDRGSYLQPGSGAAGGTAWAFLRFWGASIQSGAETIGTLTGLDAALEGADLVITGEGRFDATSLAGKVVGAIVERASVAGVPVAVVAGQADLALDESGGVDVEAAGLEHVLTLTDLAGSSEAAVGEPDRWLRAAGAKLARRATRR